MPPVRDLVVNLRVGYKYRPWAHVCNIDADVAST